ncbi:hypothetical protein LTR62_003864 [Meristemomyces frigidus]|uniref:glutaminase n=1 Tax=Meristemomyces frigidus TaxID=1508187 RepID=A0AAN7YGF9_9PEZI|nr:hypothetical protein LTR62_003864 [Meristemomyces frigidus]
MTEITIGVLALQGAFVEHLKLLRLAADELQARCAGAAAEDSNGSGQNKDTETLISADPEPVSTTQPLSSTPPFRDPTQPLLPVLPFSLQIRLAEIRTPAQLSRADALILPGGESTSISLIASRTGLLEPLRDFVNVERRPVWGTCAGLILLAEEAVSAGGSEGGRGTELIGGLDVRVQRNYFGRQVESFEADLRLSFLDETFHSVFIRAPVVEKVLLRISSDDSHGKAGKGQGAAALPVEILGRLPGRAKALRDQTTTAEELGEEGDIVAVRQGNVFGTAFHPELTGDARIHQWWLREVVQEVLTRRSA